MNKIEIPFRLPSLNQYINECRKNRYAGASMKKNVENCPTNPSEYYAINYQTTMAE